MTRGISVTAHTCCRLCSRCTCPVPMAPRSTAQACLPHAHSRAGYARGGDLAVHLLVFYLFIISSEFMCPCLRHWEIQCLNHREHTHTTYCTEKCIYLFIICEAVQINKLLSLYSRPPMLGPRLLKPPVSPAVFRDCLGLAYFLLLFVRTMTKSDMERKGLFYLGVTVHHWERPGGNSRKGCGSSG